MEETKRLRKMPTTWQVVTQGDKMSDYSLARCLLKNGIRRDKTITETVNLEFLLVLSGYCKNMQIFSAAISVSDYYYYHILFCI